MAPWREVCTITESDTSIFRFAAHQSGNPGMQKAPARELRGVGDGAVVSVILGLLLLWLVLVIVGFAIKTLFWLAVVGIVLFVLTGVFGAIRGRRGVPR
jgi:hypothetical protein